MIILRTGMSGFPKGDDTSSQALIGQFIAAIGGLVVTVRLIGFHARRLKNA
jgi:hypothetical protein